MGHAAHADIRANLKQDTRDMGGAHTVQLTPLTAGGVMCYTWKEGAYCFTPGRRGRNVLPLEGGGVVCYPWKEGACATITLNRRKV